MPYLISDPYPSSGPQPDEFIVTIDGSPGVSSPAQVVESGGKRLHYDVGSVSVGPHNVSVLARMADPMWGWIESAPSPFVFSRPSLASMTGIGLER
jgi:hypothetical protein